MKFQIEVVVLLDITLLGRQFEFHDDIRQILGLPSRAVSHRQIHGQGLPLGAQFVNLADFVDGQALDTITPVRGVNHQSLARQSLQGFTHRGLSDPQRAGDSGLHDPPAWT